MMSQKPEGDEGETKEGKWYGCWALKCMCWLECTETMKKNSVLILLSRISIAENLPREFACITFGSSRN